MRLLHTSDWHLGRGLHGLDLHEAQSQAVRQISDLVDSRGVDAVLVSGDVFDRAVPPVAAVRLWDDALRTLAEQVPVVVISGNHDSAVRLGAGADLYREGIHLRTTAAEVGRPVVLHDEHGPVVIYPIPFLDPEIARHTLAEGDEPLARSHAAVLGAAMRRVCADISARDDGPRSVVMAHAFVTSGASAEVSDSERDIRVGGVDSVHPSVFDGVHYVALGHLHGGQRVAGERVRYSGSPMRYSFSEVHQRKQVLLVDLDDRGDVEVEGVELTQPRGMAVLRASFEELMTSPRYGVHADEWVQVTITDAERPPELRQRVIERFPHALSIRHEPASGPLAAATAADLRMPQAPQEVVAAFVHHVTGGHITEAELAAFDDSYESARHDGAA